MFSIRALMRTLPLTSFRVNRVVLYSAALGLERNYTLIIARKVRVCDARVIMVVKAMLVCVLLLE